jgi:hypothetical protein
MYSADRGNEDRPKRALGSGGHTNPAAVHLNLIWSGTSLLIRATTSSGIFFPSAAANRCLDLSLRPN